MSQGRHIWDKKLTPEHGSLPSHLMRDDRLESITRQRTMKLASQMLHTHQDRQATLTGGTANGLFRIPVVVF
jgi:hypothetical protein